MLQKKVVLPQTLFVIEELMDESSLKDFRLVGGTALALIKGHRMSDDIDLFTDLDQIDTRGIKKMLINKYGEHLSISEYPFGLSAYFSYNNLGDEIKIDIMNYESEKFLKPPVVLEGIRMADIDDLVAMKLNAITTRKNRKDFIDIFELLNEYSIDRMMSLYEAKYLYNDKKDVLLALSNVDLADKSPNPKMIIEPDWGFIKSTIKEKVRVFFDKEIG